MMGQPMGAPMGGQMMGQPMMGGPMMVTGMGAVGVKIVRTNADGCRFPTEVLCNSCGR